MTENKKPIQTKLKFVKSDRSDTYISFVSLNSKTGQFKGVRSDSPYNKKICLLDKTLAQTVMPNVLYDSTLVPMESKNGFIVTQIKVVQFRAVIAVNYIPKCIYSIDIKFGNRNIRFDPLDGKKDTVRTVEGVVSYLNTCHDIKNKDLVIMDFQESAKTLLEKYSRDGYYTNKAKKA